MISWESRIADMEAKPMFLGVLPWEGLKLGPAVYAPRVWKSALAEAWPEIEAYVDSLRSPRVRAVVAAARYTHAWLFDQGLCDCEEYDGATVPCALKQSLAALDEEMSHD